MANMVYGMAADVWPNAAGSVSSLWDDGFTDFILMIPGGSMKAPDSSFVSQCNSVGGSPILQTGDSSTGGCYSGCDSYYASVATAGCQAAGGESVSGAEAAAIMAHFILYNMGGEGTGGTTGKNDIFNGWEKAVVTGHGCASYLKSYTTDSMISATDMGTVAGVNKDAGCFEVGILVDESASTDYNTTTITYMEMVDEYASNGVTCAGFLYWNANSEYPDRATMYSLMKMYPPIKANIKSRFAGKAGIE